MALATKPKASITPPAFNAAPVVSVVQHAYRVDWGDDTRPRFHHVTKNKHCACALGKDCPSVEAVATYLSRGGERAPDYVEDFWPGVPSQCPVCRQACVAYPAFNFKAHGVGWTCTNGGALHYWEARALPIKKALAAQAGQPRWVIPPAQGKTAHPGVTTADLELTHATAWSLCASSYLPDHISPQEEIIMKHNRVIRVPSLAAFLREMPPVNGKPTVVRISASEATLPQRRPSSGVPRRQVGISLQGLNAQSEIVWLYEGHVIVWLPDSPGFEADRSIHEGIITLKNIVHHHLSALGYDVREGDYALPANLQPLNARFECARWLKVNERNWMVQAAPVETVERRLAGDLPCQP